VSDVGRNLQNKLTGQESVRLSTTYISTVESRMTLQQFYESLRVPTVLVLVSSGSMRDRNVDELSRGVIHSAAIDFHHPVDGVRT
jgi:hypothetical protein